MPYVTDETKRQLAVEHFVTTPGELTYMMQQLVQDYLLLTGLTYTHIAEVLGSIEGLKADFLDRIVMPYEAVKAATNGDVWDPRLIATNR